MNVRSLAGAALGSALIFATAASATTQDSTVGGSGLVGLGSGINAFTIDFQASTAQDGSVS